MKLIIIKKNTEFSEDLVTEYMKSDEIAYDYGCCPFHGKENVVNIMQKLYHAVTEIRGTEGVNPNLLARTRRHLERLEASNYECSVDKLYMELLVRDFWKKQDAKHGIKDPNALESLYLCFTYPAQEDTKRES